jgi:hypothetical protein
MKSKKRIITVLSITFFAIGVLLGAIIVAVNSWGDLEAAMFDTTVRADGSISYLNFPAMMTTSEISSVVAASFISTHVRPIERRVRIHVSDGHLTFMREEKASLPTTPGKTEKLQWAVSPEDAVFDKWVLVRVYMFPSATLSSKDGSCGILVVDFPYFTGGQIMTAGYIASLLSLSIGLALWSANNKPLVLMRNSTSRGMLFLAGNTVIGMIVSYLGWWIFGILSIALTILLAFNLSTHSKPIENNVRL